ncbi:phasin family protein [Hydrocarboniphaga effusa]|jgi:hypothetical protein|uniref:phasin family protein n=1 Tax=Hydrocarboniphaga effusa TaxID=243629 RepID=UPI00313797D8
MKAKERLNQLKKQFDRLRKDSLASVGTTNEAIYSGLQQFADKELKALHNYYDSALTSLKSQKKSGADIKSVVLTQFDLMQGTFNTLIANARESLETVSKTGEASAARSKPKSESAPVKTPAAKKPAAKKPAAKKVAKKAAAKKAAPKKTGKKAAAAEPAIVVTPDAAE